ncbi:hypothetical protein CFC21_033717 [Triticum aestivum]|uniref:non-specific serine/threonine protein kinase n=2 Tax=Triticum aestivum TaxID=4565 RepID=A0A3B6EBS4_WHEAT|nr:hypothetical protein CFC21_033717 [Triticum aestivum]
MVLPWLGPCLLLLLAVVVSPMLAAAADAGGCAPGKCGNLAVSIPFGVVHGSEENRCAHFGFQVHCKEDVPYLGYYEPEYGLQILDIFYSNGSLLVSDVHKLGDFDLSGDGSRTPVLHQPSQQEPRLLQLHEAAGAADDAPSGAGGHGVPEQHVCPRGRVVQRDGRDQRQLRSGGLHRHRRAGARGVRRGECRRLRGAHQGWLPPDMAAAECQQRRRKMATGTILKIVGAGLGGAVLMACLSCFVWYKRKKRKQAIASNEFVRSGSSMTSYSKDLELDCSPHIFTFEELEVATDGFSASRELGDGGFGTVYKGKLKDGRVVAVKRLYKNNYRRVEQFLNEVDILSRLLHQNLVILYGCTSRMSRDLLLVYEFIANGTVADHLHGSRSVERGLTWPLRLNIAIETAEALAYLHAVEIIHRDVKTTNILLDNSFHVKVADFGLSRLFPLEVTHVSTVPQGTPGYVDPVYHQCYKLTDKSDVYSFGVVLVELISSKPAVDMSRSHSEINLANMALNRIQNHEVVKLIDPELGYDTDPETKRTIDRVAEVAF